MVMVSSSAWAWTASRPGAISVPLRLADGDRAHHVALADGADHVHPLHHLAAEVVRLAQLVPVVHGADEELRAVGVGAGVGHGHRAGDVLTLHRLILEAIAGTAASGSLGASTLDHEVVDHPVEGEPVVEAVAGEVDEVVDRFGCARSIQG